MDWRECWESSLLRGDTNWSVYVARKKKKTTVVLFFSQSAVNKMYHSYRRWVSLDQTALSVTRITTCKLLPFVCVHHLSSYHPSLTINYPSNINLLLGQEDCGDVPAQISS